MAFCRTWGVAALLAYLLLSCARHDVTADEAKVAAKAELQRVLPQMTDLGGFDVTARDMQSKWRVDIGGGTGGATIDVDKHTGKAAIVELQQ